MYTFRLYNATKLGVMKNNVAHWSMAADFIVNRPRVKNLSVFQGCGKSLQIFSLMSILSIKQKQNMAVYIRTKPNDIYDKYLPDCLQKSAAYFHLRCIACI